MPLICLIYPNYHLFRICNVAFQITLGIPQASPPAIPRKPKSHIGSDPVLPKVDPKIGAMKVRYAIIIKGHMRDLVKVPTNVAAAPGVIKATDKSSKLKTLSIERSLVANMNKTPVQPPVMEPTIASLIRGLESTIRITD